PGGIGGHPQELALPPLQSRQQCADIVLVRIQHLAVHPDAADFPEKKFRRKSIDKDMSEHDQLCTVLQCIKEVIIEFNLPDMKQFIIFDDQVRTHIHSRHSHETFCVPGVQYHSAYIFYPLNFVDIVR